MFRVQWHTLKFDRESSDLNQGRKVNLLNMKPVLIPESLLTKTVEPLSTEPKSLYFRNERPEQQNETEHSTK